MQYPRVRLRSSRKPVPDPFRGSPRSRQTEAGGYLNHCEDPLWSSSSFSRHLVRLFSEMGSSRWSMASSVCSHAKAWACAPASASSSARSTASGGASRAPVCIRATVFGSSLTAGLPCRKLAVDDASAPCRATSRRPGAVQSATVVRNSRRNPQRSRSPSRPAQIYMPDSVCKVAQWPYGLPCDAITPDRVPRTSRQAAHKRIFARSLGTRRRAGTCGGC